MLKLITVIVELYFQNLQPKYGVSAGRPCDALNIKKWRMDYQSCFCHRSLDKVCGRINVILFIVMCIGHHFFEVWDLLNVLIGLVKKEVFLLN